MAELDDLVKRADALGGAADETNEPNGEKPPGADPGGGGHDDDAELIPLEGRLCMQAAMFAAMVGKFFPSVKKVMSDEVCEEIGNELAPLARKWNMDGAVSAFKYEAEARAFITVAPLGFAIYQAIREDLRVMNAEPVPGDDTRPAAPSPGASKAGAKPSGLIQPE